MSARRTRLSVVFTSIVILIDSISAQLLNDKIKDDANSTQNHEAASISMPLINMDAIILYRNTDWLLMRYSVVIVVVGILANAINFACFYRMKKRNAQNLYLGALSVAEIFNILMNIALPLIIRIWKQKENYLSKFISLFINKVDDRFSYCLCILYSYFIEVFN